MDFHDDDERATDLLRPLRRAPRGPIGVDVQRAVRRGERRRTVTRTASVGLLVLVVLVGGWAFAGGLTKPPTPQPAISRNPSPVPSAGSSAACDPAALPVPADVRLNAMVTGADPTGRYLVGYASSETRAVPLIWDGDSYTEIDLPEGPMDKSLHDINAAGVAVGSSLAGERHIPWVVRGHQATRLAGASGQDGVAWAINASGRIVGEIHDKPVTWASPDANPVELALPGSGYTGAAVGITGDGSIVGTLTRNGATAGYVWSADGRITKLPAPVVDGQPAPQYRASAINGRWAVGHAGQGGNVVRWHLGTTEPPEVFTNQYGSWAAVTPEGWTLQFNVAYAYVVTDHGRTALNPPSGSYAGSAPMMAVTLSDDGRTVGGSASLTAGGMTAYRWTCH